MSRRGGGGQGGRRNVTKCHIGGGGGSKKCRKSVTYYLNGPQKAKIQHDKTFAAALKQDYRVAKKGGGRGLTKKNPDQTAQLKSTNII